jgi:type IV fimbrial biogenesis protein FimT
MLRRTRGLTLIEMTIGIAILSILMALALPNFVGWIENMKIRGTAESLLSGLQLARATALKENAAVSFSLSNVSGSCSTELGENWIVSRGADCSDTAADLVSVFNGKPTGEKTVIDATASHIAFNGLGRPSTSAQINVRGPEGCIADDEDSGRARCLRIVVSAGGGIRMCDPALPTSDTQACS